VAGGLASAAHSQGNPAEEFTVIPLKDIVAIAEMMRDATKKFEECAAQAPAQGWG
jgi:hypothetical protein